MIAVGKHTVECPVCHGHENARVQCLACRGSGVIHQAEHVERGTEPSA